MKIQETISTANVSGGVTTPVRGAVSISQVESKTPLIHSESFSYRTYLIAE